MRLGLLIAIVPALAAVPAFCQVRVPSGDKVTVSAKWDTVVRVSETIPTTQHLANAFTLRSSPLNKPLLKSLRDLHTNYTRLQLWFSVPNQAVAELKEATATETFWNFQYIDPVVIDFFANTREVHHVNFGTIPRWMFNVPPIDLPTDPGASFYAYTKGTSESLLKDPTGKQFADYQARIFQWYTQGGFTDEIGHYHRSDYHFKIDIWGILNETDLENHIGVEQYTKIYDAVVIAIRKIDPSVPFMGPEVNGAQRILPWAKYFLNSKNHDPAALPVQWFSLHNYVKGSNDPATWQAIYFTELSSSGQRASALAFGDLLRELIKVRDQLSPMTKIGIDELGTFNVVNPGDDVASSEESYSAYSPLYWVATGANWAELFITAENVGIPLISMTQMVGAPTQSESCSMINWNTAHPNAHYWVLKLISDNFGPGDKLVATQSSSTDVVAQASITSSGRKILLVNTSNRTLRVSLAGAVQESRHRIAVVDEASGEKQPRRGHVTGQLIELSPFAVAVISPGK